MPDAAFVACHYAAICRHYAIIAAIDADFRCCHDAALHITLPLLRLIFRHICFHAASAVYYFVYAIDVAAMIIAMAFFFFAFRRHFSPC